MTTTNDAVPPFVAKSDAYKAALEFIETAEAQEGVDYRWVLDYAKTLWGYRNTVFAELEGKADSIIKYLGGGTGLFAFGVLAKVDAKTWAVALFTLPALGCSLWAIFLAMRSRAPSPFPGLPTIKNATEYAEGKKEERAAVVAFLGQWNANCEAARMICQGKADKVGCAAAWGFAALALLLLPVLGAIILAGR